MTTRKLTEGMGAALLSLCLAAPGFAQSSTPDVRQELEALKQGQQQIQRELQEIKRLLQTRPAEQSAAPDVRGKVFALGDNPTRGDASARLTLVEFTDYQ